jgi:hypothetical protein
MVALKFGELISDIKDFIRVKKIGGGFVFRMSDNYNIKEAQYWGLLEADLTRKK